MKGVVFEVKAEWKLRSELGQNGQEN